MVPFRVLSQANSAQSFPVAPSKSQFLKSLPPLEISCLSFSDPHPFFSIACSLFSKNTGGWGIPRQLRVLRAVRHRTLSIFNSFLFISLQIPFSVTYLFSDSSALPGGWRDTTPQFLKAKGSTVTRTEEESKIQAIMKLADGPGDRWLRVIGAGGKSGHRRRRLARAGDEVPFSRFAAASG